MIVKNINALLVVPTNPTYFGQVTFSNTTAPITLSGASTMKKAVKTAKKAISLTADNQNVDVSDTAFLSLSSNDGTATNRTFLLNQGTDGQQLIIEWTGTNQGEIIDDSANSDAGNVRLSATWPPTQYDTLQLINNGTNWIKVSHSAN